REVKKGSGTKESFLMDRQARGNIFLDASGLENRCTGCGVTQVNPAALKAHPFLKPGPPICKECIDVYNDGTFTDEKGVEIYCRFCGDGGDLWACDNPNGKCPYSFCKNCVLRNFGPEECVAADEDGWKCYVCNPKPLESLVAAFKAARTRAKGKGRSGSSRSSSSNNSCGGGGRSSGGTRSNGASS
ncbi:unnamed protein product, partial [Phaeothamnion confervicola]